MAATYRRGSPRGSVCPGIAGWGWAAGVGPHRDLPAELSGSAPVGSRRGLAPWQPQLPATQSTRTHSAAWPWCRMTHSMTSALCAFTATRPHRDPTHARSSVLSESVSLWRVCIPCGLSRWFVKRTPSGFRKRVCTSLAAREPHDTQSKPLEIITRPAKMLCSCKQSAYTCTTSTVVSSKLTATRHTRRNRSQSPYT